MEGYTAGRLGLALLAAGVLGLCLPIAAAAKPTCGETVKASITLHANLSCPSQPGLTVGASGITINLNGFAILGPSDFGNDPDFHDGIDNTGFNRVTVEHGTISGFLAGVYVSRTRRVSITKITAKHNVFGIDFEDSHKGTVSDSVANHNTYDGVYFSNNHNVTLSSSRASQNDNVGVSDSDSLDTISGDKMNFNGSYGLSVFQPLTVSTSSGQLYYTVENSTANNNKSDGFHVADNTPTTLYQANVFRNIAEFNGGWGYWATHQTKGKNNVADGNTSGACFNVPCHTGP
jgi:parallel beta-helix repeat protein